MPKTVSSKPVIRTSVMCMTVNFTLALVLLTAGWFGRSSALTAEGVDSTTDVITTLIVAFSAHIAGRASDSSHPYGHERFESIALLLLSGILAAVGVGIGWNSLQSLFQPAAPHVSSVFSLVAAAGSVVIKGGLYLYTSSAGKRYRSALLRADAQNFRADVFASLGGLAGIIGTWLGWLWLDPVVGAAICMLILRTAWTISREAVDTLVDTACDPELLQEMRECIWQQEGVLSLDVLRTRMFTHRIYAEVEIGADKTLTLLQGHDIAQRVHDAIEQQFPDVKHCVVHVNPV